ncbi:interference hedgehog-like isoform X2 [Belonocnema kinseyi]|uniref:interference hedgehog-like isoform X2 n=1 Tax=Belonocnema kinseyi TaxID=2817044 RepID=UPI00143D9AF5|nr:interference hedgehog-like isoform X2 [Belonocnema kinseyi]
MRPVSSLCGAIVVFLSALGCYASGQKQELGMVFNRHPQPFIAPLGDEVFFECSLNLAAEKFAWRHRPLGSNKWEPFIQIPNSGGKTSKHVVTCDDESKAGDYRCVAFYGTSGLASDPARLTIAKIDKFSDKSDVEIKVPVGNTVPITCPVPYSAPEPVIQFYKDNNPIQSATISGSRTMIIENARASDSGKYHCTANNYITNQMYLSNYNTILTVESNQTHQNPYFIKQPQTEYKVQRGKNISLECFGAGNPVPFVTWSKLGSSLPIKSFNTPSGLTIVNAQPADRGEYDCVWSNGRYKIKSVIILTVVEAPKVVKPPKGLTFAEGGELDLSCSVTGQPEPTVEWLINGETLVPNNNVEIRGATLSISVVEKKHAGIVQCVASNEYGSHSGYNLLRVTPKQHVGGAVESREDFGIPSSRHKHTRVGGRRRGKGRKRKGPDVLVPPEQPQVTRLSDMSVMVRWSVPENNGLEIQFFKVQYREFGPKVNNGKQAKWMTANTEIPNHVRSFEVTELQPGHTYRFRIAAVYSNNDNKLSPNSVKFHLHRNTGFNANKMPIPLFTNTEALSPHRILLIWQNPDKSVDIDGFYVYHRASTSAGDYLKTTVEGKNSSRIVISHLQPDTTYEFKVQSFSIDMASEFSKILREKTKKLPVDVPVEQVLPENKPKPVETPKNSNLYAIIGGVLGGGILLGGIAAITLAYRRSKSKQNRDSSQDQAKPMTNGRVMNGGITDSKINITSNPLAGLDAVDDALQPKI